MQHLDEGTIHAYLDGALSPVEARRVQEHLSSCSICEAQVATAHGLIAASSRIAGYLDAVPGKVIPIAKKKTSRWIFSAWPAAIAATLVIGVSLVSIRESGIGNRELGIGNRESGIGTQDSGTRSPDSTVRRAADSRLPIPDSRLPIPDSRSQPQRSTVEGQPAPVMLPPANAAMQKSTVAAAPPTAAPTPAPRPSDSLERARLPRMRSDLALSEVVVTGTSAAQERSLAAGKAAAGAAAPTALADSIPAFVGCYESVGVNTGTPVTRAPQPTVVPRRGAQPAQVPPPSGFGEERYDRFALTDEAAATPGQLAVRTLDPAGRPDQMIYGAGWTVLGNRATVRNSKGQIVLTLFRTDSGVRSASVRVISCR